jgi:hypothetical protein
MSYYSSLQSDSRIEYLPNSVLTDHKLGAAYQTIVIGRTGAEIFLANVGKTNFRSVASEQCAPMLRSIPHRWAVTQRGQPLWRGAFSSQVVDQQQDIAL